MKLNLKFQLGRNRRNLTFRIFLHNFIFLNFSCKRHFFLFFISSKRSKVFLPSLSSLTRSNLHEKTNLLLWPTLQTQHSKSSKLIHRKIYIRTQTRVLQDRGRMKWHVICLLPTTTSMYVLPTLSKLEKRSELLFQKPHLFLSWLLHQHNHTDIGNFLKKFTEFETSEDFSRFVLLLRACRRRQSFSWSLELGISSCPTPKVLECIISSGGNIKSCVNANPLHLDSGLPFLLQFLCEFCFLRLDFLFFNASRRESQ